MKVYLSGAITSLTESEYKKAFLTYEKELKQQGHFVVNPVTVGEVLKTKLKKEPSYEEYMKTDLKELLDCDAIFLIPGWQKSKGAKFEKEVATMAGLKIIEYKLAG